MNMEKNNTSENGNILIPENYGQVVVWPGTEIGENEPGDFEAWMENEFGVKAKFLETIITEPDRDIHGNLVKGTGGRSDLFFAVETTSPNFNSFCHKRLSLGMRWVEDVNTNADVNGYFLWPARIRGYMKW